MDSSSSNNSGESTWLDLSKSDYAKVIFERLYCDTGAVNEVGCYFNVTESVNKSPSDYLGLFKVGYDDISQCLASKQLQELDSEEQSKFMHCKFSLEELPDLYGYYQFIYVTPDKEVCGASTPIFLLHKSKVSSSNEEITTEKVEDDFLMVRHGLEQRNTKLESEIIKYNEEISRLNAEHDKLKQEMAKLHHEKTILQQTNQLMSKEFKLIDQDKHRLDKELAKLKEEKIEVEVIRKQNTEILIENQNLKKKCETLEYELTYSINEREKAETMLQITKDKLELVKNSFRGSSTNTNSAHHYKTILDSDPELTNIVEALPERKDLIEQLENAKSMVKALEDSKNIAMREMRYLVKKNAEQEREIQRKTEIEKILKNDFYKMKCDNLVLKMFSEDNKKDFKPDKVYSLEKNLLECQSLLRKQEVFKKNLIELMKVYNPVSSEHSLERDIYTLVQKAETLSKELIESEKACEEKDDIIEKMKNSSKSDEVHALEENLRECQSKLREQNDFKKNLIEIMTAYSPDSSEHSLETDICTLLHKAETLSKELIKSVKACEEKDEIIEKMKNKRKSDELLALEENLLECQSMLSEQNDFKKCVAADHLIDVGHQIDFPDDEIQNLKSQIAKLNEDCEKKDVSIEQLNKEMKILEEKKNAVEVEVKEMTLRMLDAADLYKKQYIKIEKLEKKLKKKNSFSLTASPATSTEKFLKDKSTQSDLGNIGMRKLSNMNSDSDTGERVGISNFKPLKVRPMSKLEKRCIDPLFLEPSNKNEAIEISNFDKVDSYSDQFLELVNGIMDNTHVKISNENQITENSICETEDSDADLKFAQADEFKRAYPINLKKLYSASSVDKTFNIPCSCCGKSFEVSANSILPLMKHIEMEHEMRMCPICGKLFDTIIPPRYFKLHVSEHFDD